jgi:putative ABC transport system permease protein
MPHSPQDLDTAVLVKAAAGITPAALHDAVQHAATGQGPAKAETAAAYGSGQKQAVQVFLGLVYAVLTLAILIALMTIANAVSLAVHERTRELGLLRAVGQTRAQLRSMVRWDATIVAAFGCLLGLAVGTFIGWSVVRAAADAGKSLGPVAITAVTVPAAQLVIVLVAGIAAGVLAARRPARRAARLDVLAAIVTE